MEENFHFLNISFVSNEKTQNDDLLDEFVAFLFMSFRPINPRFGFKQGRDKKTNTSAETLRCESSRICKQSVQKYFLTNL